MTINLLMKIIYVIVLALSLIYGIVATIVSRKKRKTQCTEESNQLDDNNFFIEMLNRMIGYVSTAENVYQAFKNTTGNYGEMKLNDVLTKIQSDYIAADKVFDKDKWTKIITEVIDMTKVVNNDKYSCK